MKEVLMTIVRDRFSTRSDFRHATHQLACILALEAAQHLKVASKKIETPLCDFLGSSFTHPVLLIPVLRSGLALLPTFLTFFPEAKVGLLGLRRDEKTAIPHLYYVNLPEISSDEQILILEPMLATGNTISAVMDVLLKTFGVKEKNIILCSIVSAPEGLSKIREKYPEVRILILQQDDHLNSRKFIVPGLGDFGDRYFGTDNVAIP